MKFLEKSEIQSSYRFPTGFTLVELMVVVSIMIMFTIAGVIAYGKFNASQLVNTAGKEMLTNLRQAQSKALGNVRLNTPASCSTSPFIGYLVSGSGNQYIVSESYDIPCSATAEVKRYTLPGGVTFQGAFTMTFTGLSGSVNLAGGAQSTSIVLCNKSCASGKGATKYTLSVTKQGLIQDTGSALIP